MKSTLRTLEFSKVLTHLQTHSMNRIRLILSCCLCCYRNIGKIALGKRTCRYKTMEMTHKICPKEIKKKTHISATNIIYLSQMNLSGKSQQKNQMKTKIKTHCTYLYTGALSQGAAAKHHHIVVHHRDLNHVKNIMEIFCFC